MEHSIVKKCQAILDQKLEEYVKAYDHWYEEGALCPHEGDRYAHTKMDEIMEDVQQAHDMLHIAMARVGMNPHDYGKSMKPTGLMRHPLAPKNV